MTPIDRIEHALDRIESTVKQLTESQTSSRAGSSASRLEAVHKACVYLDARLQHLERGRHCDA
jgi:hypothetical protein